MESEGRNAFFLQKVSVFLCHREMCLHSLTTMFVAEEFVLLKAGYNWLSTTHLFHLPFSTISHSPCRILSEEGKNQNLLSTSLCRLGTIRHCYVIISLNLQNNFLRGIILPSFCS